MPTVPRIAIFLVLFGALGYFIWDQLQGQPWTWMQTVGICLMIPGFLLWLTAHIQLGTSFSLTPQVPQVAVASRLSMRTSTPAAVAASELMTRTL